MHVYTQTKRFGHFLTIRSVLSIEKADFHLNCLSPAVFLFIVLKKDKLSLSTRSC